jgi:hypothetical protein
MFDTYAERFTGMMDLVTSMTAALGTEAEITINGEALERIKKQIENCQRFCEEVELPVSAEAFRQLGLNFSSDPSAGWPKEQQIRFRYVRNCLQTELKGRRVICIERRHQEIYENPVAFGQRVNSKFRAAADDIRHSGTCLALGQSTASVLFLMRAMEVSLSVLSRR